MSQAVVIPATIDGLPVRTVGPGAFSGKSITSVFVPTSVTSIARGAFYECRNLTSVVMGNDVTSIGESAFEFCSAMNSFIMPESVKSIGKSAFAQCWSLTALTIPAGVTSIGDRTFAYCLALASVTIPNSVTSIGFEAFTRCESLASITIPNSVTSIGQSAFSGCYTLASVTIPSNVTSINSPIFNNCRSLLNIEVANGNPAFTSVEGVLFDHDKTTLLDYPGGKPGRYTIPSQVDIIGIAAFAGNRGLTRLVIPDGVTTIEYSAFTACQALTSVTIGSGVTSMGDYAFNNCRALTEVAIANGVESISEYAFNRCFQLQTLDIPSSMKTINASAFANCISLNSISVPEGINVIGDRAFEGCTELTICLFLGSPPSFFGTNVFRNSPNVVIHYRPDSSGFTTPTWNGYPCKPLISRSAVATVTKLKGTVSVIRYGSRMALKAADPIYLDDIVTTGLQSFAALVFLDGSSLNVAPKSSLTIDYDIESPSPSIHLNRGKLRLYKTPGKTIFIKSKVAAMGVRGTTLTVEATEDNGILTTTTEVLEGVVDHENLVTGDINEIHSEGIMTLQSAVEMRTLRINHSSSLGTLSVNGTVITNFPYVVNHKEGTEIDLQAVPTAAMVFSSWSGDFVSASAAGTFFLDGDMTVTANFVPWTNYVETHPSLNPNDDANGSGGSNFLDYASGQNPESAGTLPIVDLSNGLLTMRQRINGLDAPPTAEYSENLRDWFPLEEGTHYIMTSRTLDGAMLTVVGELVPISGPARFFRQKFGP